MSLHWLGKPISDFEYFELLRVVGGRRARGFEEGDFGDGKFEPLGLLEDQLGDVFRGRISFEHKDWLAHRAEHWQCGVLIPENHAVIQMVVNPGPQAGFDV